MTNPTPTLTLETIAKAHDALRAGFIYGRSIMQAAGSLDRLELANAGRDAADPRKAEDLGFAAGYAATLAESAETLAAHLPTFRALAEAAGTGEDKLSAIADAGMAIVVQYRCPTNTRGARWTARFDRDAETVFKANASFTFDDKDNEGSDNAAAACLAKFEAYCNDLPDTPHTVKVRFKLAARASLGRGAYAYTFRRS